MSEGQRRPFEASSPHELADVLPPPPEFFDGAWLRDPAQIRALQDDRLRRRVAAAAATPFYARRWAAAGFDPQRFDGLDALATIPAYTIDDLRDSIERNPPLGDYQAFSLQDATTEPLRLFMSGGTSGAPRPTLYTQWDRDVHGILLARQLWLQGIRPGDVVMNAWTYGLHNGAFAFDEALYRWLNCVVITASSGAVTSTRKQVELAHTYRPAAVLTTGDYLLRLADVAREMGLDPATDLGIRVLSNIGRTDDLEATFGLPVQQTYGFHEVGCVAAECPQREGLHVFEDAFVVEVVDVDSGEPLPDGEVGALVVTELCKTGNAQIRYNIMDLSYTLPREQCACGSWYRRIGPFQGRGDNMVKLRGVNVWPEAVGDVVTSVPGVGGDWFVTASTVDGRDHLAVEFTSGVGAEEWDELGRQVSTLLRDRFGVAIAATVVPQSDMDDRTGAGTAAKLRRFRDER